MSDVSDFFQAIGNLFANHRGIVELLVLLAFVIFVILMLRWQYKVLAQHKTAIAITDTPAKAGNSSVVFVNQERMVISGIKYRVATAPIPDAQGLLDPALIAYLDAGWEPICCTENLLILKATIAVDTRPVTVTAVTPTSIK